MSELDVKEIVRARCGDIARGATDCGGLCGCLQSAEELALAFGYSSDDLANLPPRTKLGLSCGNPQALAALVPGDAVLDFGSGAGFDARLAANKVGPTGWVLGVDMTEAMLAKARSNARALGCMNVDFQLGDIEQLPVDDSSIDVVLSNCVLNWLCRRTRLATH
jgi:arsenite methyltransferase